MTKVKISKSKAVKIIRAIKKKEAFITEGDPAYVGRKDLLEKIDEDLNQIEKGESIFRIINGEYGSGKTHLLSVLWEKAFNKDFIVSTISLSPKETTLNKIEKIYKRFIKNLRANKYRKASALNYMLRKWSKEADSKNYSFCRHGMKPFTCGYPICKVPREFHVLKSDIQSALRVCRDEWKYGNGKITTNLELVIKWFLGAKVLLREIRTIGIENRVDRHNSVEYMAEVCKLITQLGYKGIVLLFDEDVPQSTVATDKSMESFKNLTIIRNRLIRIPHLYMVYATCPDFMKILRPEDKSQEEEGYSNIAEILDIPVEFMDRVASLKELENMTMNLNGFSVEEAEEIAQNLIDIYEVCYDWNAPEEVYAKIFREFIPHVIDTEAKAGNIYENLVLMLDKARQEGNESFFDIDIASLRWVLEYSS